MDRDDWKNLKRLLRYLKRTIKLTLIVRSDGVNVIKWWLDSLYAAHDDMQGHTGGTMSMGVNGRGLIISILNNQKLNTKSYTEENPIGLDVAMPQLLYTRYFLEAQGYGIDKNILYQDNMSAMLLENNGKKSSTKNTKHINMRFYFIKCRVETGDVVIKHYPTEEMLGDHFKNPFQGALFRKFRS